MNTKELEALVIAQGAKIEELLKAANADNDWSVKLGRDLTAAEKRIQENLEAHMHLVQRADNIVEGFKKELAARDERLDSLLTMIQGLDGHFSATNNALDKLTTANDEAWIMAKQRLSAFEEQLTAVHEQMSEMRGQQDGMNDTLFGSVGRIEKLETLVLARNASAATKRNMTDEDALRVLTGDLRETSHKEAAEKIGLTYAQVYSCRLEFTFKHVHKDLRDNVKGWKNVWAK